MKMKVPQMGAHFDGEVFRRREIPHFPLHGRNLIPLFYRVSNISDAPEHSRPNETDEITSRTRTCRLGAQQHEENFWQALKSPYEISPAKPHLVYFSPPD